ncbi:hypothetical protein J6TS2_37280 [Heyndrickxia sporothermodurans]|nr:hypothetical protein J6TS2_37280 [Heyndrickxia sporothermodurans]
MKKTIQIFVGSTLMLLCVIMITCFNKSGYEHSLKIDIKPVQDVLIPERAILIDANVKNGDKSVRYINEINFEIWKKNSKKHEIIFASNLNDGTYRIQTMFPEGGEYYVRAIVNDNTLKETSQKVKLNVNKDEFIY